MFLNLRCPLEGWLYKSAQNRVATQTLESLSQADGEPHTSRRLSSSALHEIGKKQSDVQYISGGLIVGPAPLFRMPIEILA